MTVAFDNYYPFDAGAGASSGQADWRKMARAWCADGVVPNIGNELSATWDAGSSTLTVQSGGVMVDGFYGEVTSPKAVSGTSSGICVARMVPTDDSIVMAWDDATFVPTQTVPRTGTWEVALWAVDGGVLYDLRGSCQSKHEIGELLLWAGEDGSPADVPLGYVKCDNTTYRSDIYWQLFNALGGSSSPWGLPDGTHFSTPAFAGRSVVGSGVGVFAPTITNGEAFDAGSSGSSGVPALGINIFIRAF